MYTAYFGLSEAPFSIAPDPAYLYMSDRHREALAHLTHGLGDSGGFVLLTGEVGTGKTTISRTVMENLPDDTQVAFILNPTLSCDELLATICDNLKIRYRKTGATLKYLTDKIQTKLIKNHQENINTLVIIDEAQHLQPEVLEQLRLLTNLETNTKKLLQVILIGQPELQQLLQRRDLRQLAQRITARYHLLPLTKDEIKLYIQHRLSVAQCTRPLFNQRAINALHRISKGIPRVINLLCDRALIIAYGKNDTVVDSKIMRQAAIEALGHEANVESFWLKTPMKLAYVCSLLILVGFSGYWFGFQKTAAPTVVAQVNHQQQDVKNISASDKKSNNSIGKVAEPHEIIEELITDDAKNARTEMKDVAIQEPINNEPIILGYQPERVSQIDDKTSFDIVAEEGVSEDLLARFQAAVNETSRSESPIESENNTELRQDKQPVTPLHQMPTQLQNSLPTLQFEMHMYATEGQGWVRVNGEDRREGELVADGVTLTKILPQKVVLNFQQREFSMPALSSW